MLQIDPRPGPQGSSPQAAQELEPTIAVNVPVPQGVHVDDPIVEMVPVGHKEHDDDDAGEYEPALQA